MRNKYNLAMPTLSNSLSFGGGGVTSNWVAQLLAYSPIALYAADRGVYTDAGTTPATLNGDAIYQWNDQSGNGYHLTQATLAKRPTLSLTGGPNSKPIITGDGTDDLIKCLTAGVWPDDATVVAILKNTSAMLGEYFGSGHGGGEVRKHFYDDTGTRLERFSTGPVANIALNENALISFTMNGVNEEMWKNGTSVGTTAFCPASADTTLGLFATSSGNYYRAGGFPFFAIYPVLSSPNRAAIEAILNAHFAVY